MNSRRVRPPPRLAELTLIRPGIFAFGLALAALAAVFLYAFDPARGGFYPVCYFHQTTGLLCPGCGGLRAVHQLLHGRVVQAFYFNPLFVLSLPLAGGVAGSCLVNLRSGQPAAFRIRPAWLWWGGGILLVFSILRNLPGAGFAWLGLHS